MSQSAAAAHFISTLKLSLQERNNELEAVRLQMSRERAAAKAELAKVRTSCSAVQAKYETDAARALQEAARARASAVTARAEAAVECEARRVAEAAIETTRADATEAAGKRWRATLSAAAAEDPATVIALRAQISALKLAAAASAARADALADAAARRAPPFTPTPLDAAGSAKRVKGGKKGPAWVGPHASSSSSSAAPKSVVPVGVSEGANAAAAIAESAHLRAERDAAVARAAALESEVAAVTVRVHAALAGLGLPHLSTGAHLALGAHVTSPADGTGSMTELSLRETLAVAVSDGVAARAQLETLKAEVFAHKKATASAVAATTTSAASVAVLRDENLAMYRKFEESKQEIADDAAARVAQAERNTAKARAAEAEARRAAAEARSSAAKSEAIVKNTSSALSALTDLHLLTAGERDEALESVRRVTAIAAEHERRCSELHAATCDVCNMCVRQQLELAAVKREAEVALATAGGFLRTGVVQAELSRAVVIATQRQELQQQLDAARTRAEAAELLSGQRMVRGCNNYLLCRVRAIRTE